MLCLLCLLLIGTPTRAAESVKPTASAKSVVVIGLIKAAVKKVIKAIDLYIQKLQNKTIWLQNAQKQIENTLSKMKLDEIGEWTKKQRDLYKDYYEELMKVKSVITYYQRIRDITRKQEYLIDEYERAWNLFRNDDHFNSDELDYMQKVYTGILNESIKSMDQISMILESFATQMTDAKRLEIINSAADRIDANYDDLTQFNRQNILLSLQRSKSQNDVDVVKKLYGLP